MSGLSNDEVLRYSRHLLLPEVRLAGQHRLKAARVLCVGAGGLGSPVALYLAAAGVGTLGLVEFDHVDLSNIQRQVLYATSDVGRPKLEAARERLLALNPEIDVVLHPLRLDADNALELVRGYDIVVDGSDNLPTRYLVNDACVLAGKPDVQASVYRFEGQLSVFDARRGPCYRCLFPEPPPPELVPSCAEGGVLGVLPGILGSLQALEAIKLVLGIGSPMIGRLQVYDALANEFHELSLRKDPDCALCGTGVGSAQLLQDYQAFCTPGRPVPAGDPALPRITVEEFAAWRARGDAPVLIDVRDAPEFEIVRIAGARLIPLGELAERLQELDPAEAFVLSCHRGPRSERAFHLLSRAGFSRLRILAGGIDAWAARIEPALPRY